MAVWATTLVVTPAALAATAGSYGGCEPTTTDQVIDADPSTYQSLVAGLGPGDLLRLAPGTYTSGLSLNGHLGEPGRCIVIEGPAEGPSAVFTGRDCCNTISLRDSAYVVLRNLEVDGQGRLGDGVKAEGDSTFAHHVTLDNLHLHDLDADQQIVGINTKCPAWNWVVRGTVIEDVGTGMYFGNSDGSAEFVHSLIEHNLVRRSQGYNLQIKHQTGRSTGLGMPPAGTSIVRHNVFSKATGSNGGGLARPNVLVGHPPLSGDGSDDDTILYGNFFHQNPTEALFQGEGHLALYDNLLLNDSGPAVHVQPHNDVPKRVHLFHNTVVASGATLRITGADGAFEQLVAANATFGTAPSGGLQSDNISDTYGAASAYLTNPDGVLTGDVDRLDLFPLIAALGGPTVNLDDFASWPDADRDFDGRPRSGMFRGAYAGEGSHGGWQLALGIKPEAGSPIFADGFETGDRSAWSSTTP